MCDLETKIDFLKLDIKALNDKVNELLTRLARLDGMLTERGRWEARVVCECEER